MQLDLLLHLGLSEEHRLLDVGCGSLRAGRLIVPYLRAGHYFGIEPEAWLVEAGLAHELGESLLKAKRPVFSHDSNFSFSRFGVTFEFILAQSIFSHASAAQIDACLAEAARVMTPVSIFVATYVPGSRDYDGIEWAHCACYRRQRMIDFAARHGLRCEELDWPHPTSQRWLLIRRK